MTSIGHAIRPSQHAPHDLSFYGPSSSQSNPPIMTRKGKHAADTMMGKGKINVVRSYFSRMKTDEPIAEGQMVSEIDIKNKITYLHLHNYTYALGPHSMKVGGFKTLHLGVNIQTGSAALALTASPQEIENELIMIHSMPPSPYIIPIWDYNISDQIGYLFVPYCNKRDLFEYRESLIKRSTITQYKVVRSILRGLNHLHKHNIIHLDIKPDNILVHVRKNSKGKLVTEVQITDFGCACEVNDLAYKVVAEGTMVYRSPEQAACSNIALKYLPQLNSSADIPQECLEMAKYITPASDIYSLSLTLSNVFVRKGVNDGPYSYWVNRWGNNSDLSVYLPSARPTAAECLTRIQKDIRVLRASRNKITTRT